MSTQALGAASGIPAGEQAVAQRVQQLQALIAAARQAAIPGAAPATVAAPLTRQAPPTRQARAPTSPPLCKPQRPPMPPAPPQRRSPKAPVQAPARANTSR